MSSALTTIYLIRHGESEANIGRQSNDSLEFGTPLTENGRVQAGKLAEELEHVHFDAIFSSDLTRAVQTAEIVKLERAIAVQTKDSIRERAMSLYLPKYYPKKSRHEWEAELQELLKDLDDKAKMAYKHTPEMESAEEGAIRLITFLREIAVAYAGKTVLVTNHGNLIRSLLTHLGWAKYDELPNGAVENTGYIVLESDGTDFFIKRTKGINKRINTKRGW
jgi:2,3-bisphosphoglycerate-dependent phosphoglycerate mutase